MFQLMWPSKLVFSTIDLDSQCDPFESVYSVAVRITKALMVKMGVLVF